MRSPSCFVSTFSSSVDSFGRPALLDFDDDGFAVARANLDRAVERRQLQIGRAGDGEALLLAGDVPLRVHDHAAGQS